MICLFSETLSDVNCSDMDMWYSQARCYPNRLEELEREVRKELEECSLSIHLIGSAYGEIPEGSERSVVDVQNKLAAEHAVIKRSRKEDFSRLIWIAPNLQCQ